MSILSTTQSGKKLYWHIQLDKLSEQIYNTVKDFPNRIWRLCMYYSVPCTQYGRTSSYRNKMFFEKLHNKEDIKNLILNTFHTEVAINAFEVGDNHHIEDISLNDITIEIEK